MAKELIGTVVSQKMANTAVVAVVRKTRHPLYKKIVRKTKRYKAHVSDTSVKDGDTVRIQETRPLSRDKHFRIVEVLKH